MPLLFLSLSLSLPLSLFKDGKTDELKRIYSQMLKLGLRNCLIPGGKLSSHKIIDETLSGKRAIIASSSYFKSFLSERVKQKGRCGFYLSKSVVDYEPHFILFNKKFNKKLKGKIDMMYVRFSPPIHVFTRLILIVFQTFGNIREETI
jgi:hypothetical protein